MTSLTSRRILIVSAAIACMLAALVLTSAAAFAAKEYEVAGAFGSGGSGNGQFKEPSGVAVNGAGEPALQPTMGDVYVIDAGNQRIEQFSSTGAYISQWDGSATPAKGFSLSAAEDSQGIAVDGSNDPLDPAVGDVYVMDVGNKVIDRFSASGKYEGQLQGTCAAPGTCPGKEVPFPGSLLGVAVDPSGNLWVYEGGEIGYADEFSSTGAFLASFNTPFSAGTGLALDAAGHVYAVGGGGSAVEFESSGTDKASFGHAVRALAVNQATSEVLLDDGSFIERFPAEPAEGSAPEQILARELLVESYGIAVNSASSEQTIYASQSGADNIEMIAQIELPGVGDVRYSDVSETGMSLEGEVHPEGHAVTTCRFEYGTTSAYGQSIPCAQSLATVNATGEPVAVTAKLSGLAPTSQRYVRLAVGNANGTKRGPGAVVLRPTIEGESVSRVGSIEATVNAEIDPNGGLTSYRVEYGTDSVEEVSTPPVSVGNGAQPVDIAASLSNLRAGSTYDFRFVAIGPLGTTFGPEVSFATSKSVTATPVQSNCPNATFTGFEALLPDCRAYELVSVAADDTYVPDGVGEGTSEFTGEITGSSRHIRAAEAGNAITYVAGPTASGVGGNGYTGNGSGNNYLAVHGAKGWEAGDISLAVSTETFTEFTDFSDDLSVQTVYAPRFPELKADPEPAPECSEGIEFAHTASGLHALTPNNFGQSNCFAPAVDISADDNHILLEPFAALTPGAAKGEPGRGRNLYDSVDGELHQVNVLPDGKPEAEAGATLGWYYNREESEYTYDNAVSANGSRIFWTSLTKEEYGRANALYVRENDAQPQSPVEGGRCVTPADACTLQIDAAEPGAPGPSGGGHFVDASRDGSKVFFTDVNRLTKNATAGAEEPDLYEYEVNSEAGAPGRLIDLTVDGSEHADVQGLVGVSEDGSDVYFVAEGVLAGSNGEGRSPVAGQPNLYMDEGGHTALVVTLVARDDELGNNGSPLGDWKLDPGERAAEVAPGGRFVGFMSTLSLTGYENRGVPEVYVYDAGSRRIFCASCNPTGAPPIGLSEGVPYEGSFVGISQSASFMLRWINEREGAQVYFMSNQPLVPNDTNAHQDVYEWESDGSGDCREAAGCISLLSNAGPIGNAYFMDASADGSDVFITSRSALTPTALDETVKLYDARVDGGVTENRLSCTGTGCQGSPPAPPIFATPASVTYNGVGNFEPAPPAQAKPKPRKLAVCKRGFTRKRGKCVKSKVKKAKKHEHTARKSATKRGR